jgi:DNA-binding YbaB/EbfC family protein
MLMFGSLGNLTGLLKTAKDLQGNMQKLQESLAARRHEGVAGGDLVRAVVDGRGTLIDIKIDPKATGDVELLEDLVKAAISSANAKSQESMKQEMSAMTGGLDLSSFSNLLGGSPGA